MHNNKKKREIKRRLFSQGWCAFVSEITHIKSKNQKRNPFLVSSSAHFPYPHGAGKLGGETNKEQVDYSSVLADP